MDIPRVCSLSLTAAWDKMLHAMMGPCGCVVKARSNSCGFVSQGGSILLVRNRFSCLQQLSEELQCWWRGRWYRCAAQHGTQVPCFCSHDEPHWSWFIKPWKRNSIRGITQRNDSCSQPCFFGPVTIGWFECCVSEISRGLLDVWFRFLKTAVDVNKKSVNHWSHLPCASSSGGESTNWDVQSKG